MLRYLMISVVFCAVCVFYLGSLFYVQISGRQNSYQPPTKKTVSIPAVRGEIFDRNGKKLVSNHYSYDLILSKEAFSTLSPEKANRTCLELFKALKACGEEERHEENTSPLQARILITISPMRLPRATPLPTTACCASWKI